MMLAKGLYLVTKNFVYRKIEVSPVRNGSPWRDIAREPDRISGHR